MTASITIPNVCGPVRGAIRPPGSKSITNRALVCAALAQGTSTLRGALRSEDTGVMIQSLRQLGIEIEEQEEGTLLTVVGCGGKIPADDADVFVANSGTTMRFLTAMVALGQGRFRLDGIPRMRERPIEDLLVALSLLDADVESEAGNGCPPVVVQAAGLSGGTTRIRGDVSSQFLSALLMASPYALRPVTIELDGALVSKPYVEMTRKVMEAFGAETIAPNLTRFEIPTGQYVGRDYTIEPDASAASYFFAAAAITEGEVTVTGFPHLSLQGDVAFVHCLEQMGCQVRTTDDSITLVGKPLHGVDVEMNAISDTVQTLAAVALFAEGPTTIRGVGHIRHKETDRIGDLATELRKLGACVVENSDGLTITPQSLSGATIATYNDHRMAMSLALVGLKIPGVVIEDPDCTEKTYPRFFSDLAVLTSSTAEEG